ELNLHRQLYQSVIDNNIDVIFTAGDLSSSIVDALHNEPEAKNIVAKSFKGDNAKEDLVSELCKMLKPNDTVLVKASHFMDFPKIVEALKEYKGN
nr:UDP-N-acetylmuramoyl-tripeptide--D-alanyl-D-alanine ligase [Lachnospiraceae bacterium]